MSSFNSYLAGSQDKCIFKLFFKRVSRENFELSFPTFESGFEINSIKVNLIKVNLMKHFSVWYITNSQCVQLPVGLIEDFTGIADDMGSNPVQA